MKPSSHIQPIPILGIVNIPARIILGMIADRKIMSAYNLNTLSYVLLAAINLLMFAMQTLELQIIFAVVFGIGAGKCGRVQVYFGATRS
jgi:hypothetical protein